MTIVKKACCFLFFVSCYTYSEIVTNFTDPEVHNGPMLAKVYSPADRVVYYNFNEHPRDQAATLFYEKNNFVAGFLAIISTSKTGDKKFYIYTSFECEKNKRLDDIVLKTEKKNILYNRFCTNDDDKNYSYITPANPAGTEYLINQFKKSRSVIIEFGNQPILFDATGFTKAWNNYEEIL